MTSRPLSNDLAHAIDDEVAELEHKLAGAGAVAALMGLGMSLVVLFRVSEPLGRALFVLSMCMVAYFTTARVLLGRGVGKRVFPWMSPLCEISIATIIILIDVETQGIVYAATSPIPLQFYLVFLLGSVLRLRRFMPLVVGCVGALQYLLIYLLILKPALPPSLLQNQAYVPDMMYLRAFTIIAGGVLGTLVNAAIRRAVGQASEDWRAQQLFGKYKLLAPLAEGGMGSVHRALYCPEGGFQRPVALKRIHTHLAGNPEFVTAFRNEAELCSRLTHANIVQVLDFGRVGDTYFLAMEFVDGNNLSALLRASAASGRRFPPNVVAYIGREVCQGLDFAHRHARNAEGGLLRVVHRDLNPPNVLLSRAGEVKITDFGIARALGEVRDLMTTHAAGKTGYMAPEQVLGTPLDERCDLFAVGIILWELLMSRRLFNLPTDMATTQAVLNAPIPPPWEARDDVRRDLWEPLFARALARDRDARFQSAAEMASALNAILQLEGMPPPDVIGQLVTELPALVPARTPADHEAATVRAPPPA